MTETRATPTGSTLARRRRPGRFLRQVVDEVKKVVWPSRSQLITYTGVVLVFVLVMMLIVSLLDYGVGKLVLLVFGG